MSPQSAAPYTQSERRSSSRGLQQPVLPPFEDAFGDRAGRVSNYHPLVDYFRTSPDA